jgi:hypothetical protein
MLDLLDDTPYSECALPRTGLDLSSDLDTVNGMDALYHWINPDNGDTCPECSHAYGREVLCMEIVGMTPDGRRVLAPDGLRLDAELIEAARRLISDGEP